MQNQNPEELYKVIVALVTVILGIVFSFGWFVKRFIITTEDNIKILFNRINDANVSIAEIKIICDERHKEKDKK